MKCGLLSTHSFLFVFLLALGLATSSADPALAQINYENLYAKSRDSVVYIETTLQDRDGTNRRKTNSTGFIVTSRGHVVTVAHAVPRAGPDEIAEYRASIRTRYGPLYKLELITTINDLDVALLLLPNAQQWTALQFASSANVPEAALLFVMGFPLSMELSAASGILSSSFGPGGKWQTTLPLNPGYSGAPVFDIGGRVVGVAAGGFDQAQAITFVIPSDYLSPLLKLVPAALPAETHIVPQGNQPARERFSTEFTFAVTVDHEEQREFDQEFCLPENSKIILSVPTIESQNGNGTRIISYSPKQDRPNCLVLRMYVAGLGVDRVGGIIVNYRGRGWLGGKIKVEGER
jgi:S1-C subfamily serine protease